MHITAYGERNTYNVCPMTLLMFVDTSSRDRFSATTIIVSHIVLEQELEHEE